LAIFNLSPSDRISITYLSAMINELIQLEDRQKELGDLQVLAIFQP
jgi:hypothetical protein